MPARIGIPAFRLSAISICWAIPARRSHTQLKRIALARTGRNRHGGARSDLQIGRLLRRIVLLVRPELLLPRAAGGLASLPRVPSLPGEMDRVARARVFC